MSIAKNAGNDEFSAAWQAANRAEDSDEFDRAFAALPPTADERVVIKLAGGDGVRGVLGNIRQRFNEATDPEDPQSVPSKAADVAHDSGLPDAHGGAQDALRHMEWMRGASEKYGAPVAAAMGLVHEVPGLVRAPVEAALSGEGQAGARKRWRDSGMDLANNMHALRFVADARRRGLSETEISRQLKDKAAAADGNTDFNAVDVVLGGASGPVALPKHER